MAVPGLQAHVEFQETPEPRLIDRKTGGALPVTAAERQLLLSWDGSPSAARLSAAVFVKGVDVEPWQVGQFFNRLERLGCLTVPPPGIPNLVAPSSGVSKLEDKVPRIRGDLLIVQAPRSRSVFHVADPKSNRAFGLFDTEVSVARMLDGKRKVKDVIENAAKLGVEVSIDSLQHFISHLKSYRFIDQGMREGESTWPARQQWTEEERQLYQASMKSLREGHFAEALSFAESLEAASSSKDEARLLRHRVEVAAQGVVELVVSFAAMHATPQAAVPVAAVLAPAVPVVVSPSASERLITKHGRALAVGGVVLLLLLVLLRPVEVTTVVACELQVEQLGLPRTLRGGKVAARDVEPGSRVEKGAVLARLGAGESPEALAAKVKELETALAALPKPVTGKKTDSARATLQKVQSEMVALEKSRKRGTRAQQQAAEQKLRGKLRELVVAKGALDALTHELKRAPLQAELEAAREKKGTLDGALSRSIVIAPVAGVFVGDGALPEELGVNDSYGQIVATDFKLVTRDALPARLDSATFRTGEYEAEVGIVAGQPRFPVRPAFVGAKGTLEVKAGRTPWLFSLFR